MSDRDRITRNLRLAYGEVVSETIPDEFLKLLRQIDDKHGDDPDSGIGADPPKRPSGGPKSNGAAASFPKDRFGV